MQRTGTLALIALCLLSLGMTIWIITDYFERRDRVQSAAFEAAQVQAVSIAQEIGDEFGALMTIAENIAAELGDGSLGYTQIEARMREATDDRPDIDGLAITFEPFVFSPDMRLFQTYVYQSTTGGFDTLMGATYDYTRPPVRPNDVDTAWYLNTINEGAQWHEPFFAAGAEKILVEYGVPFYPVDADPATADPAGIVSIDYTLADIRALMEELDLGATGYGYVLTDEGTFLSHPVGEFVVNRTIFDVAGEGSRLAEAVREAINENTRVFVEVDDPVTGQATWNFFEPIGATGWTIGIVINRQEFEADPVTTIRDQMTAAIAIALTVFLATTTAFHVDRYRFTNFWTVSSVFSLLCVVLIILVWVQTNRLRGENGISITDQSQLNQFVRNLDGPLGSRSRPQQIPTGVLIQAMAFPEPTSVTINGYIWQRYPEDSELVRGFALPQRIGEEATIEEIQREIVDGEELIVWYIGVTLRQIYDTQRFPFDHRDIQLRVTPALPDTDVVLIPDLSGYALMTAELLPGVDPGVDINNWTLQSSYFSYSNTIFNPTIKQPDAENDFKVPELRFIVQVQRIYLGAFIAYLLPGLIAAAMTFAYLISGRRVGDNDEIVGALNYAAALFFVVAVIHTALRDQIAAVGITYMEYIYILLYLAIVAVAVNVFVASRFPDWAIVRYRDNLAPKVLYWPFFAGIMLVSTLATFVY